MMHYAKITDADMKEAAKMTILNAAEKKVHDPVHTGADSPCTNLNESDIDITSKEYKRLQQKNIGLQLYANCRPMGRAGFEPA